MVYNQNQCPWPRKRENQLANSLTQIITKDESKIVTKLKFLNLKDWSINETTSKRLWGQKSSIFLKIDPLSRSVFTWT